MACSENHRFLVAEQLQAIGVSGASIMLEPVARNTAPAIALAALEAVSRDPDAVLLVLPADHLIGDTSSFTAAVRTALPLATDGWLVTFGIHPDAPEPDLVISAAGRHWAAPVTRSTHSLKSPTALLPSPT